jgi:transcriptional regulator of heat shock response
MSITPRQQKLLRAIIKEFIDTAEAVGSLSLLDKYNFKLSSATVRNEMAELVFRGYLYKKHSSAGRIPTTKGWRFFVDHIEGDEVQYIDADMRDEVISNLVKLRDEKSNLIRQGLNFLSTISENAAVALIDNNVFYAGLANLTEIPEMRDEDNLHRILQILEDYYTLSDVFKKKNQVGAVNILIGEEETGKEIFKNYSVIFSEIRFNNFRGFIAVVGPNRMDYHKVISSVKYISDSIRFIVNN